MKAIILISSIFFILGVKISHKIDIVKWHSPVNKIITVNPESNTEKSKSTTLKESLNFIDGKDSLQNGRSPGNQLRETE